VTGSEDDETAAPLDLTKPAPPPPQAARPTAEPTYLLTGSRTGRSQLGMSIGRIIGLIFVGLLALMSLGIIFTGAVLAWVHESRGADGFLSTSTERLSTPTSALTSAKGDINVGGIGWFADHLGTIRISATSTSGKPVFIGIAPRAAVDTWLGTTGVDQIDDLQFEPFQVTIKRAPGTVAALPAPASQKFWTVTSSGTTTQVLNWKVSSGDWAVVVANADGSPGVAVETRFGAKFSWLGPLSLAILITGVVLFIAAIVITILLLRGRGRREFVAQPPSPG
jgi:hypothetical protein